MTRLRKPKATKVVKLMEEEEEEEEKKKQKEVIAQIPT
jgi:hypothetical protein